MWGTLNNNVFRVSIQKVVVTRFILLYRPGMKLQEYLKSESVGQEAFAEKIGVSQQAVALWVSGDRIPRPGAMHTIWAVTDGRVGPNDFYNVAA